MDIKRIAPHAYDREAVVGTLAALNNKGVAVYPTDTAYGLGTLLVNKRGIEKIIDIKQEGRTKRLAIICRDISQASTYAVINDTAFRILRALAPGPYTFILPAMPLIPRIMLSKQRTIGVRIPDDSFIRHIISETEYPLVNTSVAIDESGGEKQDFQAYERTVEIMVLEDDFAPQPSTVISLLENNIDIIREGKGIDNVEALL